jgi:hypothetical protein
MYEKFFIKQNYDCTYSVCDLQNHNLSTFKDHKEAVRYIEYLMGFEPPPIVRSPEEIKREERKTKLKKLFNFK